MVIPNRSTIQHLFFKKTPSVNREYSHSFSIYKVEALLSKTDKSPYLQETE